MIPPGIEGWEEAKETSSLLGRACIYHGQSGPGEPGIVLDSQDFTAECDRSFLVLTCDPEGSLNTHQSIHYKQVTLLLPDSSRAREVQRKVWGAMKSAGMEMLPSSSVPGSVN